MTEAVRSFEAIGSAAVGGPKSLDSALPRLVRDALEHNPLVRSALARWFDASSRLGLSAAACLAGAVLLSAEFDEASRRAACGEDCQRRGVPRAALLENLSEVLSAPNTATALAEIERRGVLLATPQECAWIAQELCLAPEVRDYCVCAPFAEDSTLDIRAVQRAHNPRLAAAIEKVVRLEREIGGNQLLVVIRGAAGSGRDSVLAGILDGCGKPALVRSSAELGAAALSLEPELSSAAAVWDARRSDPTPADEDAAARWLARSPTLACAVLDRRQDAPEVVGRRVVAIDVDPSGFPERREIWRALLQPRAAASDLDLAATLLARRTRCGAGLAARAIAMIEPLGEDPQALVSHAEMALDALIRPSTQRGVIVERPDVPFSRLIVSDAVGMAIEQLIVLAELSCEVESAERRGVKALFAGPSGTGKTLAARALATHLALPLHRIDLASVVSKWVGETEKNLSQALEAAETAGAILLFDEGDALLAKRGEVSRGADRYANLEVSYLLQALEAHDGIAIVTTNQKQNIDSAFQRRFDLSIEFAPPTAEARALLWRQELGPTTEGLSQEFMQALSVPELSGGNIAGAARLARAFAHRRGEHAVSVDDVCCAVAGEFRKLGSSVQAANWTNLVKRNV